MKYKHVIFDLDGTIANSEQAIFSGWKYAMDRMGVACPPDEQLRTGIGPPLEETIAKWGCVPPDKVQEALQNIKSFQNERGMELHSIYPTVKDALDQLRAGGHMTYIATSKRESMANRVLNHFGILEYFTLVAGSPEDRDATKTQVIQKVLDTCKLDPRDCIMVGDTKYDILGARHFGIPTVFLLHGFGTRQDAEEYRPEYVIDDMRELHAVIRG